MGRFLAGVASCLLLVSGALLFWQGRAQQPQSTAAPEPRLAAPVTTAPMSLAPIPEAPSADPKSREEKRFGRADKNDDGRITLAEMVEPRRKAFAKLDKNANGTLSFEEWAYKTIEKFEGANGDGNSWLDPTEYLKTAPKPTKRKSCSC